MQIIIFLIEVVLIFFLMDMDKIASFENKETAENTNYTSCYQFDESGNTILVLDSLPKEQKVMVWQSSSIKDEMMLEFPNIFKMSQVIKQRVEDNGTFKQNLIEYMEYIQGKYLAGKITQEEFRNSLNYPNPSLPKY